MSALPSVMLKKKQELAAAEATKESPDKVAVLPHMEQQSKPEASKELAPLTDDEIKSLAVEKDNHEPVKQEQPKTFNKEENDFKALKGQYERANRENLEMRSKYSDLEIQLEELKSKLSELNKVQPSKVQENDDDLRLTEEEQNEYGASLPVLNKLLTLQKRQIQREVDQQRELLRNEIENLKKNNSSVAKQIASVDEDSFLQQVKHRVRDFDGIISSEEWRNYASQPISPYTNTTIGEVLQKDAHPKRDLERVVKIFEGFINRNKSNVAAAYAAPSLSGASTPSQGGDDKKPVFKLSERRRIHDEFKKSRISFEKYKQYKELFDLADKEGRVDYDK